MVYLFKPTFVWIYWRKYCNEYSGNLQKFKLHCVLITADDTKELK